MAISAGQVFVDLGARLDRREFEAYERKLKETQERVQRKERFKAELGANYDERAFRSYQRDLDRADRANKDMIRSNGRLRTSFGQVWSRGGAAFAAAGGAFAVISAVKSVTKAYGESQVSQEKMRAQLKALGIDYDAHAKQIDNVIQKTSQLAGLDDEDLQDAFTNIVRITGDVNKSLRLTGLAADFARAKHMDVAKAGELVGKVAGGNTGILSRYGIQIDKGASATEALGLLQHKFSGQAAAYGKTQAGSMDRVKVAFENLQEIIGKRLGPTLTRAANGLANFINEMSTGEGKGGRFVDVLQTIGRGFTIFARTVRTVAGGVAGFFELFMKGIEEVGRAGSHLPGVGHKFRDMADDAHEAGRKLEEFRKRMNISVEAGKVNDALERMRKKTGSSIGDMRKTTREGMKIIKDRLGLDSEAGQEAVHRHFRSMVARIREAMKDGKIETKDGLAEIRKIMLTELKELGIPSAQAKGRPLSSTPPKGGNVPVVKAGGGWIGAPGMIGYDSIPAMLAPGEAVLNRHQQAVIEGMLGDGFLDRLFAQVNRPHFMQRGGRVHFAYGGVTPAISSLIEELDSKGFHHGSTTGPGHAPGGYHPRGMAVDYGDASNDMQKLWSVVFPQRTRFAELFGPTRVRPGPHLMHNGVGFTNATLQAGHQDHIHMALAAAIGALGSAVPVLGAVWKAIRSPQTAMGGLLGDVVQGTLDRATSLANRRGRALARTVAGPDLSGGPGGGSNSANKALGRTMAAAMGWTGGEFAALDRLWTGESGWSNTARNPSSGAFGIPQALPPGKMGPAGAGGNARAQIAWGLNYIKERYGSPSNAYRTWLGRSPHWYAKGGRAGSKLNKLVGGSTAGLIRKIRPLQTDRSARFDRLMGHVDAWDNDYSQWERRFNVTDEELVDADTGAVNVRAVQRKADELGRLIAIRARIENELEKARVVVRNIIRSYQRVIGALRKSLRHAKKKNRKGIQSYIDQYEGRVGEWKGKLGEVGDALFDTRTDLLELRGERRAVLGTTAELRDTGIDTADTGDIGIDAGGGDTGGGDTGTDTATAPPSPLDIATAAAEQMRTFLSGRKELLQSFGRNYLTPGGAGAYFSGSDALDASAGARFSGGSVGGGGLGGTVIANFASAPDNAPTFVQQMRFLVENGG